MQTLDLTKDLIIPAAKLCRDILYRDSLPDFLFNEKVFSDKDYKPYLNKIIFENNEPIAIICSVYRDNKSGYINFIGVREDFRRKNIASSLYNGIESIFIKEGVEKIRLGESVPNYYTPGLDPFYTEALCFFEKKSFKKFNDTANLKVDLTSLDFNFVDLSDKNIIIQRAENSDMKNVLNWVQKIWPGWMSEVESAFNYLPIKLFIAKYKNEVIGFSAYEVNNIGTGFFGPIGVDPKYRNKEIGGALLLKTLFELKKIGYNKAIIPWVGPIPFYAHYANAKVDRIFWRYEKTI